MLRGGGIRRISCAFWNHSPAGPKSAAKAPSRPSDRMCCQIRGGSAPLMRKTKLSPSKRQSGAGPVRSVGTGRGIGSTAEAGLPTLYAARLLTLSSASGGRKNTPPLAPSRASRPNDARSFSSCDRVGRR